MSVDYSSLEGTAHYARICSDRQNDVKSYTRAHVVYTAECPGQSRAGNALGGNFVLSFGEQDTNPLSHDITAVEMQTALRSLTTTNDGLTVTRERLIDVNGDGACDESEKDQCEEGSCGCQGDQQGGYRWYVDMVVPGEQRSIQFVM